MNEWADFRTKCPSCNNNEIITWEHCKGFGEKINKYGEVKCNNQNCSRFLHPKFIMDISFDCGKHDGKGLHPNISNVWTALGMIYLIGNLDRKERDQLFRRIAEYDSDCD